MVIHIHEIWRLTIKSKDGSTSHEKQARKQCWRKESHDENVDAMQVVEHRRASTYCEYVSHSAHLGRLL